MPQDWIIIPIFVCLTTLWGEYISRILVTKARHLSCGRLIYGLEYVARMERFVSSLGKRGVNPNTRADVLKYSAFVADLRTSKLKFQLGL